MLGCAVLIVGIFSLLAYSYREGKKAEAVDAVIKSYPWVYEYKPLNMRVTMNGQWKEIPTASLALPENFSGARFAFKKENTSCVLAYVTASEGVMVGYIDVTDQMANAGRITDSELLSDIQNPNVVGPHSIRAMMTEGDLADLKKQQEAGELKSPLTFHEAGIIFVSSHFPDFMESSRQSPMFVLYDDGTQDVPWDGHCLSDTVRAIKELKFID